MSKARSTGNLNNSILISDTGAITFVSGSTTLATLSTTGQLSGSAPALSASYAATASYATNFNVSGTITATTLVVQTITSSVDYVTGSTRFGSLSSNTHTFTGSIITSGSMGIGGSPNSYAGYTTLHVKDASAVILTEASGGVTCEINAYANNYATVGTRTSHSLVLSTNLTERMRITNAGLVGIGTSTPNVLLEVKGGTAMTSLANSYTNAGFIHQYNSTNILTLGSNGSSMILQGVNAGTNSSVPLLLQPFGGNVGIGTTSFTGWTSTMVSRIQGISGSTTSVVQSLSYDTGSGVWMYSGASGADNPSLIYLKDLRFGSATDLGTGGYVERMRITSTGDVGIGTSTIYYASSGRRAVEINGTSNSFLAFKVNDTAKSYLFQNGTDFIITNLAAAGGYLALENNGAERMRITSAGHVTKPYQPYFKYGMSYTGTITSAVRFGTNYGFTVKTDRDAVDSSYFDKATGLFTAPVAGVYIFGCTIMRLGTSGSGPVDIWITKNPSSVPARSNSYGRGYFGSYSTDYQQITIVVPIKLAVNDTVALGMQGNMTVYDDDSWFYGYFLG